MYQFRWTVAVMAVLLAGSGNCAARGATLAQLIAGETLETSRLTFDSFSYTPYAGGPSAAAINLLPVEQSDGSQGLTINGTFSSTTFSQATIQYRVAAKTGGVLFAASLNGNPVAGTNGFTFVDEVFSGGLPTLSIFSQFGTASTSDSTDFSSPRTSITVTSLLRLNGAVGSPSTLSFLEETFRASKLPADFDFDDDVDGADFLIWQRGLGTTGSNLRSVGDANSNGTVDSADYNIWRLAFGTAASPAQGTPEPSSAVMVILGCFALRRRPRRVQRSSCECLET